MIEPLSADKNQRTVEIVKRLREGIAAQSCKMCEADSSTFVRCGRGSCAWERLLMEEAADLLEGIHPDALPVPPSAPTQGDTPLTKRLRDEDAKSMRGTFYFGLMNEAADRIEQLERKIAVLQAEIDTLPTMAEHQAALARLSARATPQYEELLYAVSRKFPGESRHETALRYIRQAESKTNEPAKASK